MSESDLLARLSGVRGRARLFATAHGSLTVVLAAGTLFILAATLDWLTDLPAMLRLGMTLAVAGAMAWWLRRLVWRPATAPIALEAVAQRLERHFGTFDDRLASTVNFLSHDAERDPLTQQVVAETTDLVRDLSLPDALTARPTLRRLALAVLLVGALGGAQWASGFPGIGARTLSISPEPA
ncbi:MAG: hypothetical protein IH914_10995 [candidate division Zixibacteria bacterium]|nr:hypothetical protein [candidate division Zixibacteria bacterium]